MTDIEISEQYGDEVGTREGSRLEVDDPEYCKECGREIPYDENFNAHDPQGRPMAYVAAKDAWVVLELCPDCWAEERIEKLVLESMARFHGEVGEVLADAW